MCLQDALAKVNEYEKKLNEIPKDQTESVRQKSERLRKWVRDKDFPDSRGLLLSGMLLLMDGVMDGWSGGTLWWVGYEWFLMFHKYIRKLTSINEISMVASCLFVAIRHRFRLPCCIEDTPVTHYVFGSVVELQTLELPLAFEMPHAFKLTRAFEMFKHSGCIKSFGFLWHCNCVEYSSPFADIYSSGDNHARHPCRGNISFRVYGPM